MLNVVDVISRLKMFGYDVIDGDVLLIEYSCVRMEQHIRNYCNVKEPPDELLFVATDAVCADILRLKLLKGELPDVEKIVNSISSIREGDVQVTYGDATEPSKQLNALLDGMALSTSELNRFRRMVW